MRFKLNYVVIPALVSGTLWIGSIFAHGGIAWYEQLALPPLTPPRWIFPLVWTTISVFTSAALFLFYDTKPRDKLFFSGILLFCLNALLNISWTAVFFRWHQIGLSLWIALALECTLLGLVAIMWKRYRAAAYLLLPYTLWVLFALYLNAHVWLIN